MTERSRLTVSPGAQDFALVRSRVSAITSAVNVPSAESTTVRHTPETAIESPCRASCVTFGPRTTRRASDPPGPRSSATISPRSSTMPVNMSLPFGGPGNSAGPASILPHVGTGPTPTGGDAGHGRSARRGRAARAVSDQLRTAAARARSAATAAAGSSAP